MLAKHAVTSVRADTAGVVQRAFLIVARVCVRMIDERERERERENRIGVRTPFEEMSESVRLSVTCEYKNGLARVKEDGQRNN